MMRCNNSVLNINKRYHNLHRSTKRASYASASHYTLLFGRVHRTQRPLLNRLQLLSAGDRKRLIESGKTMLPLQWTRQIIIDAKHSLLPRVRKACVGSRVVVAREVLLGIDPSTVIRADGTKLTNTHFLKSEVLCLAYVNWKKERTRKKREKKKETFYHACEVHCYPLTRTLNYPAVVLLHACCFTTAG